MISSLRYVNLGTTIAPPGARARYLVDLVYRAKLGCIIMTTVEPSTKQELADVVGSVTCGATWFTADTPHGKKNRNDLGTSSSSSSANMCVTTRRARERCVQYLELGTAACRVAYSVRSQRRTVQCALWRSRV